MPLSEFNEHWHFWKSFKWGMTDDLLAITAANDLKFRAPKSKVKPVDVKEWTLHSGYTYKAAQVIVKPVSAIRSGFMAMMKIIGTRK